jgi:hypothetical protein
VNPTERTPKTPTRTAAFFATLAGLLRITGTGARSRERASRGWDVMVQLAHPPSRLMARPKKALQATALIASLLLIGATTAQAAVTHNYLSQITGVRVASAVAFDEAGDVYVGDSALPVTVDRFTSAGAPLPFSASEPYVEGAKLTGTPSGPFEGSASVAVDYATGEVYVADIGGVDVFRSSGEFVTQLTGAGAPPVGEPSLGFRFEPTALAFNQSTQDLYVATTSLNAHGNGVLNQGAVDEFTASGEYVAQFGNTGAEQIASAVAVNETTGNVYSGIGFGNPAVDAVDVFEPLGGFVVSEWLGAGTPSQAFGDGGDLGLGIDPVSGHVYAVVPTSEGRVVDEFAASTSEEYLDRLTGTPTGPGGAPVSFTDANAVAVAPPAAPSGGDVYIANGDQVDVFGPGVVVPDVQPEPASEVERASAVFNGQVNPLSPETHEGATCKFDYGTTEALGETAPCSEAVAEGEALGPVHADVSGLLAHTTYYYRLLATNNSATNTGEGAPLQSFHTLGLTVGAESASDVTASSATLEAGVDPNRSSTSYRFEYDTSPYTENEAPHGISVPVPDESLGAGASEVSVPSQHIQNLTASTTYYYRVVAFSEPEAGHPETADGEDRSFTTQGVGEFMLPDHRAYEMVSPPAKDGALLQGIGDVGLAQAAAGGAAFTYVASNPTEPEPAGSSATTQVFSTRGSGGWQSHDLAMPHAGVTEGALNGNEYRFFGEDLSSAIVQPFGGFIACTSPQGVAQPCLSPDGSEQTPFLRDNATGAYTPLVTGCPGGGEPCAQALAEHANVPAGTVFGQTECHSIPIQCGPVFVDATTDDRHVAIESAVALTATALPPGGQNPSDGLYEWNAGEPPSSQLQLVSVLPEDEGGTPAPHAVLGAGADMDGRGAISADGSRVFWASSSTTGAIYMRDVATRQTLRLDLPEAGCGSCGGGNGGAVFQLASRDGSRVLFTDTEGLTASSGAAGALHRDLYECVISEAHGEPRCELSDLTPTNAGGESASAADFVSGASEEDFSYVYFAAGGVLENDGVPVAGAVHGQCSRSASTGGLCNMYVRHDGVTRLVAVLSGDDVPDWDGRHSFEGEMPGLRARVSPNGRWFAFTSAGGLTGYDSRDAASGTPDEEVYEYDAVTGHISCASCDPSGGRPTGERNGVSGNLATKGWSENSWLAAVLPGWTQYKAQYALYQSRYLSNNGRLFFNARSALVPADVNNQWDVYEYEPEGLGSCTSSTSSGSSVFKPAKTVEVEGRTVQEGPGCVSLISSGESHDASAFLDASATGASNAEGAQGGGDVFFLTTSQLAKQDLDNSYDVYDAHECTTESPCTQAATSPPPCDNEASCKPGPEPQPSIYGLPSSATFSGPGNLTPPPPAKARTAAQIRAEKLKLALKLCRRKHNKKKRASCEKAARKAYGATKAKKSSHTTTTRKGGK